MDKMVVLDVIKQYREDQKNISATFISIFDAINSFHNTYPDIDFSSLKEMFNEVCTQNKIQLLKIDKNRLVDANYSDYPFIPENTDINPFNGEKVPYGNFQTFPISVSTHSLLSDLKTLPIDSDEKTIYGYDRNKLSQALGFTLAENISPSCKNKSYDELVQENEDLKDRIKVLERILIKPDGNTEQHAANREPIYQAALYVLTRPDLWKDKHIIKDKALNISELTGIIVANSFFLFNTYNPPQSEKTIYKNLIKKDLLSAKCHSKKIKNKE